MANTLVFSTLSKIGYPLFKQKLRAVTGVGNLPPSGGYILAANHVDWLDGFYIAAAIGLANGTPVHFLSASNNYWWTTVTIQIPADRRGDIVAIAAAHLKKGEVICNFIEGRRNTEPKLLPGKTGTVRMAAAAGVPVVPLGITCSAGRNMGQSLLYLMSTKHPVTIAIGQPIRFTAPPEGVTKEWLELETGRLMEAIGNLSGKKP